MQGEGLKLDKGIIGSYGGVLINVGGVLKGEVCLQKLEAHI